MKISKKRYNTILWDLDGTLVNPKRRLYFLFCELTRSTLTYEEYWNLKYQGYKQDNMLQKVGYEGDSEKFHRLWLENVERPDLLELDTLVDCAWDTLHELKNHGIKMYIVTNRQLCDNLLQQLRTLEIWDFFEDVISTAQKCSKAEAVRKRNVDINKAIFVGDTDEDMKAVKELKIDSILISEDRKNMKDDCSCSRMCIKNIGEVKEFIL